MVIGAVSWLGGSSNRMTGLGACIFNGYDLNWPVTRVFDHQRGYWCTAGVKGSRSDF